MDVLSTRIRVMGSQEKKRHGANDFKAEDGYQSADTIKEEQEVTHESSFFDPASWTSSSLSSSRPKLASNCRYACVIAFSRSPVFQASVLTNTDVYKMNLESALKSRIHCTS